MLNTFFLSAFPYIAVIVFLIGTIFKYRSLKFQYSSLSSQFLEGNNLFWGIVPFHWGLGVLFLGHLAAWLVPEGILAWNSHPVRLLVLEATAFVFALSVLVGLITLLARRLTNPRVKMVTNRMDIWIEVLILAQVILGCWTALGYRWGSSWFATDLSPYLWSLLTLNPEMAAVEAMPLVVRLHIAGAFLILFVFPFTRLVHLLVAPFHYMWRPYQRVIWNWDHRTVRDPKSVWNQHPPKNN
jgi:nitrate reductase gamma subunit